MNNKTFTKKITTLSQKLMCVALVSTIASTTPVYANANLLASTYTASATALSAIAVTEAYGDLENATVTWQAVDNATGYNVYYKSASNSSYTQLDTELIRAYSSHMRADIPGLAEGNYIIRIVPIIDGTEVIAAQAITSTISVKSHTREGFAFSKSSPMGTGSGGYNDNGTVAENAQVVYVSADTINTVTLNVVTSSKGTTTKCTGLTDILTKRQKGYDKTPLIIRMIGTIDGSDISGLNSNGYMQLKGLYNTTFEGVGDDATVRGWGLLIRDCHNVEVRNMGFMLFPDDGISLDTNNENIWVHNNDIFYGNAGSDADQVKGDGSCDVKGFSNYVTVSYNHFFDSGKSSLCGMSDTEEFFVTYHHNWFDHSDSRHPRIRVGTVHIYNNYFDGNAKYGVGVTKGSSAFVEANYFRNCKNPMLISLQGSDIAGGSKGNFSGEPGGMIKAYNNEITGAKTVYHTANAKQFDAYLAKSRNEVVSSTYQSVNGANTYNNFDTSSEMYAYTPDAPSNVASVVTAYAGRVNGGDFSWTFTSADDTDYKLNVGLMAAIKGYNSDLVTIGGNSIPGILNPSEDNNAGDIVTPDKDNNAGDIITPDKDNNAGDIITPDKDNNAGDIITPDNGDNNTGDITTPDNGDDNAGDVTTPDNGDNNTGDITTPDNGDDNAGDVTTPDNGDNNTGDITTPDNGDNNTGDITTPDDEDNTVDNGSDNDTTVPEVPTLQYIHNFTTSGSNNDFFAIKGNLSSSKGTVTYNGLTLATCLKVESATNIAFTTATSSTLTLVFNSNFNKEITIDGVDYKATNGVLTLELKAGTHKITKADTANLFYIALS